MSFWGSEFIFDGTPCREHGLMVYNFGNNTHTDANFQVGIPDEDHLANRFDKQMHRLKYSASMEHTFIFGPNPNSVNAGASLDRYEIEAIAAWLVGHEQRKWLDIIQDDMDAFRYKCLISNLKLITYGDLPWAFSCTVSCDSPFAYTFPEVYKHTVNGTKRVRLHNRCSYNGFYYPKIELVLPSGGDFSIENASDGGRQFEFKALSSGRAFSIYLDNKNQVITEGSGINLYNYFNMCFFRLVRGDNALTLKGNAEVRFVCEFPVNIGG